MHIKSMGIVLLVLLIVSVAFGQDKGSDFGTYKAREIRKSDVWINSVPLTIKSLKGKVIVLDFWAFDCAPCIEAMPQIASIYNKYSNDGLVVIGVHTPRVDYEKDVSKLREAVARLGVRYPVVVDNDQRIFHDYLCDLWPTRFVIDRKGIVRFSRGGGGRYEEMDELIQKLLSTK